VCHAAGRPAQKVTVLPAARVEPLPQTRIDAEGAGKHRQSLADGFAPARVISISSPSIAVRRDEDSGALRWGQFKSFRHAISWYYSHEPMIWIHECARGRQRSSGLPCVARERSFTRAAAGLGVSSIGRSATPFALEVAHGYPAVTRTTRAVSPPRQGSAAADRWPHFEEIDAELEALTALREKAGGDNPHQCG